MFHRVIYLFIIIFIVGCNADVTIKNNDSIPFMIVEKGDIQEVVSAVGAVMPHKRNLITAPIGGKILKLCPEATFVNEGDLLVQFDTTEIEKELLTKELELKKAQANLDKAIAEFNLLEIQSKFNVESKKSAQTFIEAELKNTQKNLEREKRLYSEKIGTIIDVEDAQSVVRAKSAELENSEIDIEIAEITNTSSFIKKNTEINLKKFELKKAEENYDTVKKNFTSAIIKSPCEGIVIYASEWAGVTLKTSEGDEVNKNSLLMTITDISNLVVETEIRENEITKVKIGQKVKLIQKGTSGDIVFDGKVKTIISVASENPKYAGIPFRGVYTVIIDVTNDNNKKNHLYPGMNIETNIITNDLKNIIYIPLIGVISKDGEKFVNLKTNDGFKEHKIVVSAEIQGYAVIKEGLKEGDKIGIL